MGNWPTASTSLIVLAPVLDGLLDAAAERASAGPACAEVVVSAAAARGMLLLRVRDNGPGMPPEVIKDIFTPFYTTKQLGRGTGMGLSIVYGVVQMHAGEISVESRPGRGTKFSVRLPLIESIPLAGKS
jgi:signal transduction histidine kinase